jgi:D-glycero-D-manno-heptose 1,7-bisphosphate phosphatase
MSAKNKAVFLDRDGVLNQEMGDYVRRLEDFHILDNFDALKTLQDKGIPRMSFQRCMPA